MERRARTVGSPDGPVLRFRQPRAGVVAVAIAAVVAVGLALSVPATAPGLLVPVALGLWVLRSRTVVDREGLTLVRLLGSERVPWSQVDGLRRVGGLRAGVRLSTTDGRERPLPQVGPAELGLVVAVARDQVPGGGPSSASGRQDRR